MSAATTPPETLTGRTGTTDIAFLVAGAAAFYVCAMVLMKYWGILPPVVMAATIAGAFALGAWFEMEALKIECLSAVSIAILAGGVFVLSGIALAAT